MCGWWWEGKKGREVAGHEYGSKRVVSAEGSEAGKRPFKPGVGGLFRVRGGGGAGARSAAGAVTTAGARARGGVGVKTSRHNFRGPLVPPPSLPNHPPTHLEQCLDVLLHLGPHGAQVVGACTDMNEYSTWTVLSFASTYL